ncbi:hypothetical protein SAMN05216323_11311 [Williamwhitmania taraxaci]|uniref:Uncharacterized protein n=1 Tax=Williamwhitmania taraxaci TaxID=1640674 RepID=A0A1G6TSJ6_9BACT|nr:hypothetical protein SAMN05216323_11311 [Williamwhitmania taraxaci]
MKEIPITINTISTFNESIRFLLKSPINITTDKANEYVISLNTNFSSCLFFLLLSNLSDAVNNGVLLFFRTAIPVFKSYRHFLSDSTFKTSS